MPTKNDNYIIICLAAAIILWYLKKDSPFPPPPPRGSALELTLQDLLARKTVLEQILSNNRNEWAGYKYQLNSKGLVIWIDAVSGEPRIDDNLRKQPDNILMGYRLRASQLWSNLRCAHIQGQRLDETIARCRQNIQDSMLKQAGATAEEQAKMRVLQR